MAEKIQRKVADQNDGKKTLQAYIKSMEGEIKKALPSVITPERFTRMVFSALSVNPLLGQCTSQSFLGAMMTAAQLGLEPNTPLQECAIVPRKNHGVWEAQFQFGYPGLLDLAYRSGEISIVQAHVVRENDHFEYEYGLNPKLVHIPADKDRGKPIKVYAMFKTKNDGFGFQVMSYEEALAHGEKYSPSYSSQYSAWQTSPEEMAKKTVLKKTLKFAPKKSEFVRAMSQDETIKTKISEDMYEVADETVYDPEYTEVDGETGEVK